MTRLLIVSVKYDEKSTGGAAKSFVNIISGLKQIQNITIQMYYKTNSKFIKKVFEPLGFSYFLYVPLIIRQIKRFKPHLIMTQSRIAFSATLAAKMMNVPIITLIRDASDICPKHMDVIQYGKACEGLKSRAICYKCINYWRNLRVLIGNKPRGWQYSMSALISSIIYKIRYFAIRLNLNILKSARVVVVASQLMKDILTNHIDSEKIKVINITPIKAKSIAKSIKKKDKLLFVIPNYGAAHKGLDFVLRLAQMIPEPYKVVIVGGILDSNLLEPVLSKITNIGYVEKQKLDKLYRQSLITLVPSFFTEAFGRIIIESIVNKTPVITSPNCGANSFFSDKEYLKVVPLKLHLWRNTIVNLIQNPVSISDGEIQNIYTLFSIEKSREDLSEIIKDVLKN